MLLLGAASPGGDSFVGPTVLWLPSLYLHYLYSHYVLHAADIPTCPPLLLCLLVCRLFPSSSSSSHSCLKTDASPSFCGRTSACCTGLFLNLPSRMQGKNRPSTIPTTHSRPYYRRKPGPPGIRRTVRSTRISLGRCLAPSLHDTCPQVAPVADRPALSVRHFQIQEAPTTTTCSWLGFAVEIRHRRTPRVLQQTLLCEIARTGRIYNPLINRGMPTNLPTTYCAHWAAITALPLNFAGTPIPTVR